MPSPACLFLLLNQLLLNESGQELMPYPCLMSGAVPITRSPDCIWVPHPSRSLRRMGITNHPPHRMRLLQTSDHPITRSPDHPILVSPDADSTSLSGHRGHGRCNASDYCCASDHHDHGRYSATGHRGHDRCNASDYCCASDHRDHDRYSDSRRDHDNGHGPGLKPEPSCLLSMQLRLRICVVGS